MSPVHGSYYANGKTYWKMSRFYAVIEPGPWIGRRCSVVARHWEACKCLPMVAIVTIVTIVTQVYCMCSVVNFADKLSPQPTANNNGKSEAASCARSVTANCILQKAYRQGCLGTRINVPSQSVLTNEVLLTRRIRRAKYGQTGQSACQSHLGSPTLWMEL